MQQYLQPREADGLPSGPVILVKTCWLPLMPQERSQPFGLISACIVAKAAKHKFGLCSWIYDPSVTATIVPSAMAWANQSTPCVTFRSFQIHVCPQPFSTSMKLLVGTGHIVGIATEHTFHIPGMTSSTVATSPFILPDRLALRRLYCPLRICL